jgi:hypothetical protein
VVGVVGVVVVGVVVVGVGVVGVGVVVVGVGVVGVGVVVVVVGVVVVGVGVVGVGVVVVGVGVVGVGVVVVVVGVVVVGVGVVGFRLFLSVALAAVAVATVFLVLTFFTVCFSCFRAGLTRWVGVLPERLLDDAAASATLAPAPRSRAVIRETRRETRVVREVLAIPPHRGAARDHGTAATNLDAYMKRSLDVCTRPPGRPRLLGAG